jgi:hypothetical protein
MMKDAHLGRLRCTTTLKTQILCRVRRVFNLIFSFLCFAVSVETSKLSIVAIIAAVVVSGGFFAYSVGARAPKIDSAVFFKEEKVFTPPPPAPPQPKRDKPPAPACANGSPQGSFCVIK